MYKVIFSLLVLVCVAGCGGEGNDGCLLDDGFDAQEFFEEMYSACVAHVPVHREWQVYCGVDVVPEDRDCVREMWFDGWTQDDCRQRTVAFNAAFESPESLWVSSCGPSANLSGECPSGPKDY